MEVIFIILLVISTLLLIITSLASLIAIFDWSNSLKKSVFKNPWSRLIPISLCGLFIFTSFNLCERNYVIAGSMKTPIIQSKMGSHKVNGFYLEGKFMPLCNSSEISRTIRENRKDQDIPNISKYNVSCYSDTLYIYRFDEINGFGVALSSKYEIFDKRYEPHDLALFIRGKGPKPIKEKTK